MALAGISVVAVGGYALFVQLSANALKPATTAAEAGPEPAAIVATGPAEEGPSSVSAAPQETSRHAEITISAVPAANTAPGREGLGRTPKFASDHTGRSIFLYRLRKFTHAFAELAEAKGPQRTTRRSSPQQRRTRQPDWER
jgi:hypothetical protein